MGSHHWHHWAIGKAINLIVSVKGEALKMMEFWLLGIAGKVHSRGRTNRPRPIVINNWQKQEEN
jgi:hypothetical protein